MTVAFVATRRAPRPPACSRSPRSTTPPSSCSGRPRRGVLGRVALGSVTDRLVHSSAVPVAMPPRGYRCGAGGLVTRVTAAYGGTDEAERARRRGRGRRGSRGCDVAARLLRRAVATDVHRGRRTGGRGGDGRAVGPGDRGGWTGDPRSGRRTRGAAARPRGRRRLRGRAGTRRSRTSSGATATCWWSGRAPRDRSHGSSWAHARPRSSGTRRSRSSSSRAAPPPSSPTRRRRRGRPALGPRTESRRPDRPGHGRELDELPAPAVGLPPHAGDRADGADRSRAGPGARPPRRPAARRGTRGPTGRRIEQHGRTGSRRRPHGRVHRAAPRPDRRRALPPRHEAGDEAPAPVGSPSRSPARSPASSWARGRWIPPTS